MVKYTITVEVEDAFRATMADVLYGRLRDLALHIDKAMPGRDWSFELRGPQGTLQAWGGHPVDRDDGSQDAKEGP